MLIVDNPSRYVGMAFIARCLVESKENPSCVFAGTRKTRMYRKACTVSTV